jgi:hypothetical protein
MEFLNSNYRKSPGVAAIRMYVKQLYIDGRYKDLIEFVDNLYGWAPGELKREYTQEEAEFCLRQIVGGIRKDGN